MASRRGLKSIQPDFFDGCCDKGLNTYFLNACLNANTTDLKKRKEGKNLGKIKMVDFLTVSTC
jgi:hypothetical protein